MEMGREQQELEVRNEVLKAMRNTHSLLIRFKLRVDKRTVVPALDGIVKMYLDNRIRANHEDMEKMRHACFAGRWQPGRNANEIQRENSRTVVLRLGRLFNDSVFMAEVWPGLEFVKAHSGRI